MHKDGKDEEKPFEDLGLPEIRDRKLALNKNLLTAMLVIAALAVVVIINSSTSKKASSTFSEAQTIDFGHDESPTLSMLDSPTNKRKSAQERLNSNTTAEQESIDPSLLFQLKQVQEEAEAQKQEELFKRLKAPTLVLNSASYAANHNKSADKATAVADQTSKATTVKATRLGDLGTLITEGTLIHAILESAINSDLPGSMRAVVSRPVYSADGSQQLIHQGDRIIMSYKSHAARGATRIFAAGSRLIRADGVAVDLESPANSALGIAGVGADQVDSHFWKRFGESSLLALIGAGAANIGVDDSTQENSASNYRQNIADSFSQAASESFSQNGQIGPTLHVNQGKRINIFVAKDIDFSSVM